MSGYIALIDFENPLIVLNGFFFKNALKHLTLWTRLYLLDILYTNIKSSCVSDNRYHSEIFHFSLSVRQGCPSAALLFIIVAEILAIGI